MKFILFLSVLVMMLQCGNPEVTSIEIVIKDNTFIVDDELVQRDSLEQILEQKKETFDERQPNVIVKAASDTKRGKLADLETILRRLDIRKIQYNLLDSPRSR